jgi:predicted nucleic acid-binding protein
VRLYLDANALIYAVEGPARVREQVLDWIDRCEAADGLAITSDLSRMETRVKPMRLSDRATLDRFETILGAGNPLIVPLTPDVVESATHIRAEHGFRAPDALHLATAVLERADFFLTSDRRLKRFTQVEVAVLSVEPVSG